MRWGNTWGYQNAGAAQTRMTISIAVNQASFLAASLGIGRLMSAWCSCLGRTWPEGCRRQEAMCPMRGQCMAVAFVMSYIA